MSVHPVHGGVRVAAFQRTANPTAAHVATQTPADRLLRWGLVGTAIPGLLPGPAHNPLPMPVTMDVLILGLLVTALAAPRIEQRHVPVATFTFVALGYLTLKTTFFLAGDHPAPTIEFVRAYKAFLFVLVLVPFVGRQCFTKAALAETTQILLCVTAVKYGMVIALGGARPGVWIENNFELMTLIGFSYLSFSAWGSRGTAWMGLLCGVTLISGSRSGLLELGLVLAVLYLRPRSSRFPLHVAGLSAMVFAADHVVRSRAGGDVSLVNVDRYHFYKVFVSETSAWGPVKWMVGTPPLSALSDFGCSQLGNYRGLISNVGGTDTCYSVLFHMYALRAIFDQGIVGCALLVVMLWRAAAKSAVPRKDSAVVLGILGLNAISVSSINNEFGLLPVLAMLALVRTHPGPGRPGSDSVRPALPRAVLR